MSLLTEQEFKTFEQLIGLSQMEIAKVMENFLIKKYGKDKVHVGENYDFIYAIGDIPIALLSHMDTVFEEENVYDSKTKTYKKVTVKRNPELYYDQWKEMIACPQGAGFDDRAGIYAIVKLINMGHRPSIILTTDEEIGCVGAQKLVDALDKPLSDINYLIQLDRRGSVDCVFYSCANEDFQKYIENFGFVTAIGSYTDISTICPHWGIAGVNLSIGYEREHGVDEVLFVKYWKDTIAKVNTMLAETDIPTFRYISKYETQVQSIYPYAYAPYDDEDYYDYTSIYGQTSSCSMCNSQENIYNLIPLIIDDKQKHICIDCYEKNIGWCKKCGDAFVKKHNKWQYCRKCSKEKPWKLKK